MYNLLDDLLEESMDIDVESFKYPPELMSDMELSTFCEVSKERFMSNYERAVKEFIDSYDEAVTCICG